MTYRSVVVGTDGSETAALAVHDAARMAAADAARLVIVTAFESVRDRDAEHDAEQAPEDIRWQLGSRSTAEEVARQARRSAGEEGAPEIVVHAVEGRAAEVVLDVADEFDADLIVVGSRGLTSAARFVLGSVAGTVAHHAPCDVLVVHTTA